MKIKPQTIVETISGIFDTVVDTHPIRFVETHISPRFTSTNTLLPTREATRVFHVAEHVVREQHTHDHVVTPETLHALLYYVQSWNLAITGRPIFRAPIVAHSRGPVVAVLDQYLTTRWTEPVTIPALRLARIRFHLDHLHDAAGDIVHVRTRPEPQKVSDPR